MDERPTCCSSSPTFAVFCLFFHFRHFHWVCSGVPLWFCFEFSDSIKENSPLFLISLISWLTSPQTLSTHELSQRLNVLGHWALLQVSPSHFTLFMHELATPILESCHSLSHQLFTNVHGDFLRYLGHKKCSDLEPTHIWWAFWVQLTLLFTFFFVEFDYSFCWLNPPPHPVSF